MKIGLHGRDFKAKSSLFIEKLLGQLAHYSSEIWLSSRFVKQVESSALNRVKFKTFELGDNLKSLDFLFSLGGDGTMLESVTYVGKAEVPILGITSKWLLDKIDNKNKKLILYLYSIF